MHVQPRNPYLRDGRAARPEAPVHVVTELALLDVVGQFGLLQHLVQPLLTHLHE